MNFFKWTTILLISLFFYCNNPFATREPEPPSEERSTWLQPTKPEWVLDNLKFSIQEGNLPNYMKCLTDTNSRFQFIPDGFVEANNQGFFNNWDLSSEQNYIAKVFSASYDSIRRVTFNELLNLDYQDSVKIKIEYDLELHHNLAENFPKNAKGQAEFRLNTSNGEWYITRWVDYGTKEQPSWSSIKVSFGK